MNDFIYLVDGPDASRVDGFLLFGGDRSGIGLVHVHVFAVRWENKGIKFNGKSDGEANGKKKSMANETMRSWQIDGGIDCSSDGEAIAILAARLL